MNLIAAVDKNWAIGRNNKLLVSIPDDMKFFRETTTGKIVVMGRKTLESFPGKKPLKNRVNIVLTSDHSYQVDGAVIVHDMDELHEELKNTTAKIFTSSAVRVFTDSFWMSARWRTLQKSILLTRQMPGSRIWMKKKSGWLPRTARSRPILIWNIISINMKRRHKA